MALYEYNNGASDDWTNIGGIQWRGMAFTVGTVGTNEAHTLTSIKLLAGRVNSPGTLTLNVYADDGSGKPTGASLSSGTINANGFTTDAGGAWQEITMSSYALQASTKYIIVESAASGDTSNYVKMRQVTGNPYAGGDAIYSSNSGTSWTVDTGIDQDFEVYGTAVGGGNIYQINIGDTWKTIAGMQINIGDTWKAVEGLQINIGDTWKTIF